MANQVDNITLNDDTTGLNRAVDVANDDLFLSVDLTLQSGAILTSDNIKRGTADPNIALLAGNEGDVYQRTLAATGQLWVNVDGTTTGWVDVATGATPSLTDVLAAGNATNGEDILITSGDAILGSSPGGSIPITAGDNTAAFGAGGSINLTAGIGGIGGTAGDIRLSTQGLPSEPGDIQLNSSGAVTINPASTSVAQITGASLLQFDERASMMGPPAIVAGQGRYWVRNDTPNVPMFTDDAGTDWILAGAGSADNLATVLVAGNSTGGSNIEVSNGDALVGETSGVGNGGDLPITAGSSTGGGGDGGDVIITPGAGNGAGDDGIVQVNGIKHYASSATNPVAPTPADGDRYYNTTLGMEMCYDAARAKWLSIESSTFYGSDANNLFPGGFLQAGNVRMSATRGWIATFDGTVVALGWTRDDSDSVDFAVTADGTTFSSVTSTAVSGKDTTLNDDFNEDDVLGLRNDGPFAPNDSIVWFRVRWRV